jgi:hypothetical protein
MASLTNQFLTNGPAETVGGDFPVSSAFRISWQEISRAIIDAGNKKADNSKKVIEELKALRDELKQQAERNVGKTLGQLPPGVHKEFLDVARYIKQITGGGASGTPSDNALPTKGDIKQLAQGLKEHTAGLRNQALKSGSPIGVAAMAGADALIPGMGIVVKAIQENSGVIKDTYHALKGIGSVVGDTLSATTSTVKRIHDFMNPEHPLGIVKGLEKLVGAGILGTLGLGALALFGPDKIKEQLKKTLSGLNDKLGDLAKEGREDLQKKLLELVTPSVPKTPSGEDVPLVPWSDPLKHPGTWLPNFDIPDRKMPYYKLPGRRTDPPRSPGGTTQSTTSPVSPSTPSTQPSPTRPTAPFKGPRGPGAGGGSRPRVLMPSPSPYQHTPGLFKGDDSSGYGSSSVVTPDQRFGLRGSLGGGSGTLSDDLYHPMAYTEGGGTRSLTPAYSDGFNSGTTDKGDVVVVLMKKQTELLSGILDALTGGRRGFGGGSDGIQLASLTTGGDLTGGAAGLSGGGFPGGQPGFPGSGFGAGFPRRGGGGGGGRPGTGPSTGPTTPDTPAAPAGPSYQTLLPPGTGPLGPSTSAFTPSSPFTERTATTRPNPAFAPGGSGQPDPGLFSPQITRTQGPFDPSKLTTPKLVPNTGAPDPGMFAPPTNIGGTPGGFTQAPSPGGTTGGVVPSGGPEGPVYTGRNLGGLSAEYESGGRPGDVTRDEGPGRKFAGYSYGAWQMLAPAGGGAGSQLSHFFASNPKYQKEFAGLTPGSEAFNQKWHEVATKDPEGFKEAQRKQAQHELEKPGGPMETARSLGYNVNNRGVYEAIWSGAQQHGGINKILAAAAKDPNFKNMSPADQIRAYYAARANYTDKLNINPNAGRDRYYKRGEQARALKYAEEGDMRKAPQQQQQQRPVQATQPPGAIPGATSATGGTLIAFKGLRGEIDTASVEAIAKSRGQTVKYFDHTDTAGAAKYAKDNPNYSVIAFSAGANRSLNDFIKQAPPPQRVDTVGKSANSGFQRGGLPGVDLPDHANGMKQLAQQSGTTAATQPAPPSGQDARLYDPATGAGAVTHSGTGGQMPPALRQQMEYAGTVAGVRTDIAHGIEPGHARHTLKDPAGDVDLYDAATGKKLDARNPADLEKMKTYARAAAAAGATGIGFGKDGSYMGFSRMHVGGGTPVVWGAGGRRVNAPDWLVKAWEEGRQHPMTPDQARAAIVASRQQVKQATTGPATTQLPPGADVQRPIGDVLSGFTGGTGEAHGETQRTIEAGGMKLLSGGFNQGVNTGKAADGTPDYGEPRPKFSDVGGAVHFRKAPVTQGDPVEAKPSNATTVPRRWIDNSLYQLKNKQYSPIHRDQSTPVSHEDIEKGIEGVKEENHADVPMPRERPVNLGVKGGGSHASDLHHEINTLKDRHSKQVAKRKPATQHSRGGHQNRHHGTPHVNEANHDIAAHIASSTMYLS